VTWWDGEETRTRTRKSSGKARHPILGVCLGRHCVRQGPLVIERGMPSRARPWHRYQPPGAGAKRPRIPETSEQKVPDLLVRSASRPLQSRYQPLGAAAKRPRIPEASEKRFPDLLVQSAARHRSRRLILQIRGCVTAWKWVLCAWLVCLLGKAMTLPHPLLPQRQSSERCPRGSRWGC